MLDLTSSTLFNAPFYVRHNQRRLEHLASLGLDLFGKTVLEPGAGVGDHTIFYLDRGCRVTAVEPREGNCALFRRNMEQSWTPCADRVKLVEAPFEVLGTMTETFDIVHCYGFLYHVGDPAHALAMLARRTHGFMVLETCVSMDPGHAVNIVEEPIENPAQALDGKGCRPTRPWLMRELASRFRFVYATRTQPAHDEFPLDWTKPWPNRTGLTRAVFVASHGPIVNPNLVADLPLVQTLL
jgi:SAM-dependent methyltransferase